MASAVEERVPPLIAGEKLTREEFLRRWEAEPGIKKAELIGGIVYMPSPLSRDHGKMESKVGMWLGIYEAATPGTESAHNATTFLLEDCPQPDLYLRILPEFGGGSRDEGIFLGGKPELLVEVCRSSATHDLQGKYELYQEAQVPEYMTILLLEEEIRWHIFVDGKYELMPSDAEGVWRSRVFPGLWLDGPALLAQDWHRILARLQEGLRTPEHERFVAELAARKAAGGS